MRKKRIIISSIVGIAILLYVIYLGINYIPRRLYPVNSYSKKLSIAEYSWSVRVRPIIALKHYIDGVKVADYILEIEDEIGIEEVQKYDIPKLEGGSVDVVVELRDDMDSNFTVNYENANDLYKNGLLIYLYNKSKLDDSQKYRRCWYSYFVSGNETICYSKYGIYGSWEIITDMPKLKRIPKRDGPGEPPIHIWSDTDWEKNEWKVIEYNQ